MKFYPFCGLLLLVTLGLTACSGSEPALRLYLLTQRDAIEQPHSPDDTHTVPFTVEPGTPARTIGRNLEAAGLIDDDLLFEAYVRVHGLTDRLHAGDFALSPSMTLVEIVDALQQSQADSVRVTIPEGWRYGQIVDHLAELDLLADDALAAYAAHVANGDQLALDTAQYPFLAVRPAGASLEGFLFPDTYEIPMTDTTATDVLRRQLDAFANQVVPLYEKATASGLTDLDLYTVLTLASIVEREAVVASERPAIAGVYFNRLTRGMKLEADPTVQYAMGYQPDTGQWWKTPVFLEEYSAVDSPYNTSLYPGLPPGPIANPGLGSIQAVLSPAKHDYLYFVALPEEDGRHIFAETFTEHTENVRNYLGQ